MTQRQIEQRSEQYPQGYQKGAPWYDYDRQVWMVNETCAHVGMGCKCEVRP